MIQLFQRYFADRSLLSQSKAEFSVDEVFYV